MASPSELGASGSRGARTLGGWELVRELGRGGMGAVYVARRPGSTREVALKVLLPAASQDPEAHERFRREALATARLSHPNIVGIEDYGVAGAYPFIVMKLAEGPSLREALRAGPLAPERAARIALRLARALEHAHQRGVLHRDIKPENVLLAADDEPRLTDFGLAKLAGGDARERLTRTGDVVGTPCYMAPEQTGAACSTEVDPRTDVYALGATLYEALAGRPPFLGVNVVSVLADVVTRPPEPLDRSRPGLPPALVAVCQRCLEKEPSRRFASAAELAAALEETLAGPAAPVALERGRRPGALLLGGGAILALGALAAALVFAFGGPFGGRSPRAPEPPRASAPPAEPAGSVEETPEPAERAPAPSLAERLARRPTEEQRHAACEGLNELKERVIDIAEGKLAAGDLAFFERLAREHAYLGFPHLLRAVALQRLGRDADALAALDAAEAAEVPYSGFFVHAFRGRWLHEQGRAADALPHLRSAWEAPETTILTPLWDLTGLERDLSPDVSSRRLLGDVAAVLLDALVLLGRGAEGAALAAEVPQRVPPDEWLAFERLAWCLAEAGRLEEALRACEEAHARCGGRLVAPLTTRARLLARRGEWTAAEAALQRAEDVHERAGPTRVTHPDVYLARAELALARARQAPGTTGDGFASPAAQAAQPIVRALEAWRTGSFQLVLIPPVLFLQDPRAQERARRRLAAARQEHLLRCLAVYADSLVLERIEPEEAVSRLLGLLADSQVSEPKPSDPEVQALCERLRRGG